MNSATKTRLNTFIG